MVQLPSVLGFGILADVDAMPLRPAGGHGWFCVWPRGRSSVLYSAPKTQLPDSRVWCLGIKASSTRNRFAFMPLSTPAVESPESEDLDSQP